MSASEEWQKYLSYNDNKKLLEDMDELLPKIRSRAIRKLCPLYKMIRGLMQDGMENRQWLRH